ncbi:MAG: Stp1/IreP family PP2C-type Ser/Thr phosphatase [Bacillota bacterium]
MAPFEATCKSDVGRVRQRNEDSALLMHWQMEGHDSGAMLLLAAVADGMGGHANGHLASKMALRALAASLTQGFANAPLEGIASLSDEKLVDLLAAAVDGAVQKVNQAAEYGLNDMGCTLTAALLVGSRAFIANIGDSRAYLIAESPQQITTDHSVVAQLVSKGELTPEEARVHPRRNEIYRMIGFGRPVQPDLFTLQLQADDVLLLCSDGLSNLVSDEELQAAVAGGQSLEQAAQGLVDVANSRGGDDNITVVLVRTPMGMEGR